MTGATLSALVDSTYSLREVRRSDLRPGDLLNVKTCNSVYTVKVEHDGRFTVSGGWFDRKGKSPATATIRGCTWGGSVIKVDIIAACGLRIEFGNRLVTSPIQKIFVFSRGVEN